jgi:tRNA(adenine34) deaminase
MIFLMLASNKEIHEMYMKMALQQAKMAYEAGEIPVGAIVVSENHVISRSYNQVQQLNDPTAHAEMLAITSACNQLGSKYLSKCTLYVTLEPCLMCAGAIKWAQIQHIVYGASDLKAGYSLLNHQKIFSKNIKTTYGILEEPCGAILLDFFRKMR